MKIKIYKIISHKHACHFMNGTWIILWQILESNYIVPFCLSLKKVAKGNNLINQQIEWKISGFSLLFFMYTVFISNKPLSFGTHLCYFWMEMKTKVRGFIFFLFNLFIPHQASSIFRFYNWKGLFLLLLYQMVLL